jgi:hypothetical protein
LVASRQYHLVLTERNSEEWISATKQLKFLIQSQWNERNLINFLIVYRSHSIFHYLIEENRSSTFDELLVLLEKVCGSSSTIEMLWYRELSVTKSPFCLYNHIKAMLPTLLNNSRLAQNQNWTLMILAKLPDPLQMFAFDSVINKNMAIPLILDKFHEYLKSNNLMQGSYGVLLSKLNGRVNFHESNHKTLKPEVPITETRVKPKTDDFTNLSANPAVWGDEREKNCNICPCM